ncbi:MAG: Rne/Rng family ribonuclease [Alphaproteobacteria bacterium]|nr:Rne/Rng family ribonuclease [Alphaproteobacteria bacterium]
MTRELLVETSAGELRAALVEDGALLEVSVERRARSSLVGNIYKGRVLRIVSGIGAAFVDIGLDRAGFLPLRNRAPEAGQEDAADAPLTEGEAVCVQVTRDAIGDKGAQLSRRLSLAGRYLVYTPEGGRVAVSRRIGTEAERERLASIAETLAAPGEGFILRTAAEGVSAEALAEDAAALRDGWQGTIAPARDAAAVPAVLYAEPDPVHRLLRDHDLAALDAVRFADAAALAAGRAYCDAFAPAASDRLAPHTEPMALFEIAGVDEAIEGALSRRVSLPSGGGLVIDQAEALCAIDVNSGRYIGGTSPGDSALSTNLEAAAEVARQLRLRNIGGLVAIDFIDMPDDAAWQQVADALEAAMAGDRARTRVIGRTAGGLIEATRRRQRESLVQTMAEPCPLCAGDGHIVTAESVALEILRALRREAAHAPGGTLAVTASVPVIAELRRMQSEDGVDIASATGRPVTLHAEAGRRRTDFDIRVE